MNSLKVTVLLAIFAIFSKVLGLVRHMVFANRLGASGEVDIYVAAFRIPDLLFNLLILGTLSAAFLPVLVSYLEQDRQEAWKIASTIWNLTLISMAFLSIVGFLTAPWFVKLLVPGFSNEAQAQTLSLTRVLMLSPILFSISSVLTSILHSFQKFFVAAVAPFFYNLAIIFGVIFWYPRFGLQGIVWAVIAGAALHFLVQLPQVLRLGFSPFRYLLWQHPGVRKISRLFLPRILGIDLGQVGLLITSVIGSSLATGTLAIFYYSYDLNSLPLGIFAISFAMASFPVMAKAFAHNDIRGFQKFFAKTTVQMLFLIIPISVWMLLLRAQLVRLIYGAGQGTEFTFADTRMTAQSLGFFALSLFAQSLAPLLARAFYAMQNTIIPVVSGIISTLILVTAALLFTRVWGAETLALAYSLAITVHMIVMLTILHRKLRGLEDEFLFIRLAKISIASIIMGSAVYLTLYAVAPLVNMQTYFGLAVQTIATLLVAVVTYLSAGLLIKLPESRGLWGVLRTWYTKFSRPVTTTIVNMFTDLR